MGMMTRMRDNAHVFIIAFAVVFIAFWVISDVDVGSLMQGGQNDIAVIDGKAVPSQEFQKLVDQRVEEYRQQNNGKEPDDATVARLREEVWNTFISQAVIKRAAADYNLSVTDEEKVDWLMQNPPQELQQFFTDTSGQFDWQKYRGWVMNPNAQDRQWLNSYLLNTEKQIEFSVLQSKIVNILTASVPATDLDLRTRFMDENMPAMGRYIFFDPRTIAANDTARPSEEEFKAYYEKYRDDQRYGIKVPHEMRRLKYVFFEDLANANDSSDVKAQMQEIQDELAKGRGFDTLVTERGEQAYKDQWISEIQMMPAVSDAIVGRPVGTVVGPVANENGVSLFKITETKTAANPFVAASHILIKVEPNSDDAAQKAKAESILARVKAGEDFSMLASQFSEDQGSRNDGGKLGWFTKGRMIPEFETACFGAKVGDIVGPVKTSYGYHIIKVTGRTANDYKVTELRVKVQPSTKTRNEVYERARDFAYYAKEHGFEAEAQSANHRVMETTEFSKQSGAMIPGIGMNASLVNFAFENGEGTLSGVYRANNGYVVCIVSGIREKGYRPLDEMKDQLAPAVVFERQLRIAHAKAKELRSQGSTLEDIAAKMPGLRVDSTGRFVFAQGPAGVGPDGAFIGTILKMKPGEISDAFKSRNGAYIVQLLEIAPFDETTFTAKREDLRKQALAQNQQEFIRSWFEEMKNRLDIRDNRERFYR